MGWALCRFNGETDCRETGSQHYHVLLKNLDTMIDVPSMWKHYMLTHLVQPNSEERDLIMRADPSQTSGKFIQTRSLDQPKWVKILYVEKTDSGYTHDTGTKPDIEFIDKLELILAPYKRIESKGKPGMR